MDRTASMSASANGPMWNEPPALANRMSSDPVGSLAVAIAAATSSSTVTSATTYRAERRRRPTLDRGDGVDELLLGPPADGDVGPVGRQLRGDREADAGPAPGDEGGPAVDPVGHQSAEGMIDLSSV